MQHPEIPPIVRQKLAQLPESPGVYIMKSQGSIIYVGKAVSLKNRVRSYFQSSKGHSVKVMAMVYNIDDFDTILCDTGLEALVLENILIKKHKPKYNILLKDDKTYPYVRLDIKSPFPVVELVRKVDKDGAKYFGPYFGASMVRDVLESLRQSFPIRTCARDMNKKHPRPCVQHEIGNCLAPCTGNVSKEEYDRVIADVLKFLSGDTKPALDEARRKMEEYSASMQFEQAALMRDKMHRIEQLAEKQKTFTTSLTDRDVVAVAACGLDTLALVLYVRSGGVQGSDTFELNNELDEGTTELLRDFLIQHYEEGALIPREILLAQSCAEREDTEKLLSQRAGKRITLTTPQRGEKRELALMAEKNAIEAATKRHERLSRKRERTIGACEELAEALNAPVPRRIEAYDISHFQGDEIVASMVVFIDGEPEPKEYRHFKIRTVTTGQSDDFLSMKEVIQRRFTRLKDGDGKFTSAPDMVLIDGGKGQLSHALEAFGEVNPPVSPLFFGLAKQFELVYLPGEADPVELDRRSNALHLLERIRDEAHRFAVTYNRRRRASKTVISKLDDIPGVGPSRRRALLTEFKSVKGVSEASFEQLCAVRGMTEPAARAVYERFHA